LYNTDYPPVEKDVPRYKKLLAEFGCDPGVPHLK